MPQDLRRFHHSAQSHFLTFSCYHRQPKFDTPDTCDLFVLTLEEMRQRFAMCIYGYVVMPEHVHLLVSEPGAAFRHRSVPRFASVLWTLTWVPHQPWPTPSTS